LSPSEGQVSHVLLTRAPLSLTIAHEFSFDLHVLGTPPAFILSQDQTLRLEVCLTLRLCLPQTFFLLPWMLALLASCHSAVVKVPLN
jgi:hypothetical protein